MLIYTMFMLTLELEDVMALWVLSWKISISNFYIGQFLHKYYSLPTKLNFDNSFGNQVKFQASSPLKLHI